MQGKIKKILPPSIGKNDIVFIRVQFSMINGKKKYAHVDLVPIYDNYKKWASFLKVGNIIGGLRYWGKSSVNINADSTVKLLEGVTV